MGFLAPLAAPIAAKLGMGALGSGLLQAGMGAGGALLGSKLSGGSGGLRDPKSLTNQLQTNIRRGGEIASALQPQAQGFLDTASRSFSPVADFYGGVLGGGRGRFTSLLGPGLQQIEEGYRAPTQAAANLAPRGGPRASMLQNLPYQKARDISTLYQSAPFQAAAGLQGVGQAAAATGANTYNTILSALSGAGATGGGLLNYDVASRAGQFNRGKAIGQGLFDLFNGLDFGTSTPNGGDKPITVPGVSPDIALPSTPTPTPGPYPEPLPVRSMHPGARTGGGFN